MNFDSSQLSGGSPAQFHDAVDRMDPSAYVEAIGQTSPAPVQNDDPMAVTTEEVHTPTHTSDRRHAQSQSMDFQSSYQSSQSSSQSYPQTQQPPYYPASPTPDVDLNARYPTPPTQLPPQLSRPNSSLSGNGGYANPNPPSSTYADQNNTRAPPSASGSTSADQSARNKNSVVIKVGMVGDAQIGKTSLMVKYVEGSWDEDYIQTLGVNFMEKTISIRNTEITFSIWDLGGQREFVNMLPLVCNDAVAILFMFDLTRKSTLNSIKEWYRQGRGFNKTAIPFLVGTKYDHFVNFPREDQEEISNQVIPHPLKPTLFVMNFANEDLLQARRFAKAMRASLIFSSTSHSINVQKVCLTLPNHIFMFFLWLRI